MVLGSRILHNTLFFESYFFFLTSWPGPPPPLSVTMTLSVQKSFGDAPLLQALCLVHAWAGRVSSRNFILGGGGGGGVGSVWGGEVGSGGKLSCLGGKLPSQMKPWQGHSCPQPNIAEESKIHNYPLPGMCCIKMFLHLTMQA